MDDKKFTPQKKPFKTNKICEWYRAKDQFGKNYIAKFFVEKKVQELNIFQSVQYNQSILSDLSDQIYPQHFLQIQQVYSIPDGYIFVTDRYDTTLDQFLKSKVIEQKEALQIFQQIVKAVYSLNLSGFWTRSIRPEHFVKIGSLWKIESLVFNEEYDNSNGFQCQYTWNPSYQPPQAYGRKGIPQQELEEMLVWHLGSLLVDILLSFHKLKDQSVLNKFQNQPFSFKAIGVPKKFSENVTKILSEMLHHNPKKRMKLKQLFSNEFISKTVAAEFKKGQVRKNKIYLSGKSKLSISLSQEQPRHQENLTIKQFAKQKQKKQQNLKESLTLKKNEKLQTGQEIYNSIKNVSLHLIAEEIERQDDSQLNQHFKPVLNAYKSNLDRSELLLIASGKLQKIKYSQNVDQTLLLNKFALTFVSLMYLNELTDSMNRNKNLLEIDGDLWSAFQISKEFKALKEIVNFRRNENKNLLNPLKESISQLKANNRKLMKEQNILNFFNKDFKTCTFNDIKQAYRKIVKQSYDIVTREFNIQKSSFLGSLGMYMTYCLAIDKLYIKEDMQKNFKMYFQWTQQKNHDYVALDEFQRYLDQADKKILVNHSIQILQRYFQV